MTGWIVRSAAGRDKEGLLCVLSVQGEFLLLADGKRRSTARPKRKKRRHVEIVDAGAFSHIVLERIRAGEEVSDRELRRALDAFRAEQEQGARR